MYGTSLNERCQRDFSFSSTPVASCKPPATRDINEITIFTKGRSPIWVLLITTIYTGCLLHERASAPAKNAMNEPELRHAA